MSWDAVMSWDEHLFTLKHFFILLIQKSRAHKCIEQGVNYKSIQGTTTYLLEYQRFSSALKHSNI